MNRDYDTNRGVFTHNSFCGRILSDEEIEEILFSCNIPVSDYTKNITKVSDVIDELLKHSRRAGSLSESRRIGDAVLSLSYSLPVLEKTEPTATEDTLDSFLKTFKIVQGGVSL